MIEGLLTLLVGLALLPVDWYLKLETTDDLPEYMRPEVIAPFVPVPNLLLFSAVLKLLAIFCATMAFAVEAVYGAGTCLILPADFVPVIWFVLTTLNLGIGVLVLRLPTDAE